FMSETRIDRMSDIKSYISNQKNIIQHDDFFGRRLDIALCFDHGIYNASRCGNIFHYRKK
ncbi:hypothetical protein ACLLSK_003221, partial [Salmonella enterica]